MTHHPIRTLPDGTRAYSAGQRYTPVPFEERKYGWNRPDDPRAVRFHALWFVPLDVLPDDQRQMPLTRPDSAAYAHMARGQGRASCVCDVCRRPESARWKRLWTRDLLRLGEYPDPARIRH